MKTTFATKRMARRRKVERSFARFERLSLSGATLFNLSDLTKAERWLEESLKIGDTPIDEITHYSVFDGKTTVTKKI